MIAVTATVYHSKRRDRRGHSDCKEHEMKVTGGCAACFTQSFRASWLRGQVLLAGAGWPECIVPDSAKALAQPKGHGGKQLGARRPGLNSCLCPHLLCAIQCCLGLLLCTRSGQATEWSYCPGNMLILTVIYMWQAQH